MANITEEHLHHMARRHHATMQKLDTIKAKITVAAQKSFGLLETGAGAWAGGLLEGRTGGASVGPLPFNLLAGVGFLVLGYGNIAGEKYSEHFNNLGNGFIGSYLAALGYAFGKRWRETGKILGGGGHPWTQPYENGWPKGPAEMPPPPTKAGWEDSYVGQDSLSPEQMAAIVQRMQTAAGAPAY